jgi:hypothetical protein
LIINWYFWRCVIVLLFQHYFRILRIEITVCSWFFNFRNTSNSTFPISFVIKTELFFLFLRMSASFSSVMLFVQM